MEKVTIYEYLVLDNPKDVFKALRSTGFKGHLDKKQPEKSLSNLARALKHYVNNNPEKGYKLLADLHPDTKLILEYSKKADEYHNTVDGEDDAAKETDSKEKENMQIGATAETQSKEDLPKEKKEIFTQPVIYAAVGIGLTLALVGVISTIVKK